MRYEGRIFRPPSEARSYILQATIGCSWNHCTYCDMYRDKSFRVRELEEVLEDLREAGLRLGSSVRKVFVADGDALVMDMGRWTTILCAAREAFPALEQVSCYAMATNVLTKSDTDLETLAREGLGLLYLGPESGDDATMKRIAKGSGFAEHVEAARRARLAGLRLSAIFLLGVAGQERSREHALASARLATEMDPQYLAALTVTVVPGTPLAKLEASGRFAMPELSGLMQELRIFVGEAAPTDALFRTNHASNYLALGGHLPRDRERIVRTIDLALAGELPFRAESARGL